jgi:chromosome segregation ATPase
MGLLSIGELSVYKDFAASVFGLSIPLLMVSLLSITGLHFWKKKKSKNKTLAAFSEDEIIQSIALPSHSSLLPPGTDTEKSFAIKDIKKQLVILKARQVAISKDYSVFKKQTNTNQQQLQGAKIIFMENFEDKITGYEKQIAEMQRKIDMLETMPASGNNETHYLRELLAQKDKEINDLRAQVNEVKVAEPSESVNEQLEEQQKEIERLKKLISGQEYVNELLDETRQQVGFMQNQLEQRIKAAKILEQRINSLSEELSQQQFQFHEAGKKIISIENLLDKKEEEAGQARLELDKRDNEIMHLKEEVLEKANRVASAENSYNELVEENEHNKMAITNDQQLISSLNQKLLEEKQSNEYLRQELRSNREMLYRFYQELKSSMPHEQMEGQLVVA